MIIATGHGIYPIDIMVADIDYLADLGAVVLDEHTDTSGMCSACSDVPFPCSPAVLAENAIACRLDCP